MASAPHLSSNSLVPETPVSHALENPSLSEPEGVEMPQSDDSISNSGVAKEFHDDRGTPEPIGVVGNVTKPLPGIYTAQEVTKHNSETDLWIIVGSDVYDVTEFQHHHPGGADVMRGVAGKDATKKFDKHHRRGILEPYKPKYLVGVLLVRASAPRDKKNQADTVAPKRKGGLLGKLWR